MYVRVCNLKKTNLVDLSEWLIQSGVGETYYYSGGWDDKHVGVIAPHLIFEVEEDAMAYVLAHGGKIEKQIPII
jgi:hypothetical protein